MTRPVLIDVFKYDGRPHMRWPMNLLGQQGTLLTARGESGRVVDHFTRRRQIPIANQSVEFYWLDRLYTVAAEILPGGEVRRYYCNIILPPAFREDRVTWVDMDLDLWVYPNGSWSVVDEDEFEAHARSMRYPADVQERCRAALQELIGVVETRGFPFDGAAGILGRREFGAAE